MYYKMLTATTTLKVSVPKGLPNLLHQLSKEVIRANPDDIYGFLADHLKLLIGNYDDDEENPVELIEDAHTKSKQSQGFNQDEIAATKIQAGFRGYKTRQELQRAAKAKLTDEEIARRLKPPLCTIKEEEEAAATKIQAGVRGFLTRKRIKHSLDYSFDDGFGGMGSSVENSAGPTPEPPLDRPELFLDAEHVPDPEPQPQSPIQSVPSFSAAVTEVAAAPVTVSEVQAEEDIYKIGTLEDSPTELSEPEEPNLHVETQPTPGLVAETPKIQEHVDEPKISEDLKPDVIESKPSEPVDATPSKSAEEKEALLVAESTIRSVEESLFSSAVISDLPESLEEIKSSKAAELGSLPIAQVAVTDLIGVFEHEKPEAVKHAQLPQTEAKVPETIERSSSIQLPEPKAVSEPVQESESIIQEKQENIRPAGQSSDSALTGTVEPPVQRRSSKRKPKAGTEKYRSGFIIEKDVNTSSLESMQIPSLEEVEAEIEAEMLNNAAAKIQAGFRGFQVRKGLNQAATRIQSNYRGYKTRKELRDKALAATKIQATVRGFLARRRIHKIKYQQQRRKSSGRRRSSATQNQLRSQAILQQNVDAATRIQAAYRGYLVRSKMRDSEPMQ